MIPEEAVGAVYDRFRHLDITTSDIEGILEAAESSIIAKARYRLGKYLAEADGKEVWSQVPEAYLRQANEILRG